MVWTYARCALAAVALAAAAGCTVHDNETPNLAGPSSLALTLRVTATPDSINQDGGSQSTVKITAIGPDGRPLSGVAVRIDMFQNGVGQDYGTLSARSVVTGSDGTATVVYTAPPTPPNGLFPPCGGSSLPGTCIAIRATPIGNDLLNANTETVTIRLMPPGVILPPAGAPVARMSISTPQLNLPTTFDASASDPGTNATAIVSYAWSFGDGSTGSGRTTTHIYQSLGTFTVNLTVTNDRGIPASASPQTITVTASPLPTGDWVFSPATPVLGDDVHFTAAAVRPAPGRTIVGYDWNFGDGTSAGGVAPTHRYTVAGTYNVVLTATDDSGQAIVITKSVVIGTGNPEPVITFSPTTGTHPVIIGFSSTGSRVFGGASASYQWDFGDIGSGGANTSVAPNPSHNYAAAGTYSVTLTITDSVGRVGVTRATVTIQ